MNEKDIYFDCASTIKPYDEVLKVFNDVSLNDFANSSSNHALGFKSNTLLEKARGQVAKYLSVLKEEVIFTSCASESNNLAIKGVAYHNKSWADKIITTKGEHPSVLNVFKALEKEGFKVVYLNYDKEGNLDFKQLENELDSHTSLVSIMRVNNEVGYIFDTQKAYKIVKEKSRAIFHIDATQAIGKEDINSLTYDLLSFSGHKIGGLKGSGVLLKKKGVELDSLIIGGSQEMGFRAGTSSLALDCSLASALRITFNNKENNKKNVTLINEYLRSELSKIEEVKILSPKNSSPFILSFALLKHKGSIIAEALSQDHIYVSTKSACSSKEEGYSYVVKNAGYDDNIAYNAIRLSFKGSETIEECSIFIAELRRILSEVKEK